MFQPKSILVIFYLFSALFLSSCDGKSQEKEVANAEQQELPVQSFKNGAENINTQPNGGICMMGGRKENDNAMRWFLQNAEGGDVLVMRASGSDGYNDYFFSELGVAINSVETLVFEGKTEDLSILEKIDNAEAIWFAGGNQENYIDYWKDNAIETALQRAITRGVAVGGTSAGMAILGEFVWTGEEIVTGFLDVPFLENTITDTHFSERNRMPRLQQFMKETGAKGIAADEFTAICIDGNGIARVYGDESEDDLALFISEDLEVIEIKGLPNGESSFDLSNW